MLLQKLSQVVSTASEASLWVDGTANRSFQSVSPSSWSVRMKHVPVFSLVRTSTMSAGTRWSYHTAYHCRSIITITLLFRSVLWHYGMGDREGISGLWETCSNHSQRFSTGEPGQTWSNSRKKKAN